MITYKRNLLINKTDAIRINQQNELSLYVKQFFIFGDISLAHNQTYFISTLHRPYQVDLSKSSSFFAQLHQATLLSAISIRTLSSFCCDWDFRHRYWQQYCLIDVIILYCLTISAEPNSSKSIIVRFFPQNTFVFSTRIGFTRKGYYFGIFMVVHIFELIVYASFMPFWMMKFLSQTSNPLTSSSFEHFGFSIPIVEADFPKNKSKYYQHNSPQAITGSVDYSIVRDLSWQKTENRGLFQGYQA